MNKIDFKKLKDSISDTIFIGLSYMSGDGDYFDEEEVFLEKHIKFSNYTEHLEEIEKVVEKYKLISRLTDCNDELYKGEDESGEDESEDTYKYIKNNYSEELADLYDKVPFDSTVTWQLRKAHLCTIKLCGYNEIGEYFESYV